MLNKLAMASTSPIACVERPNFLSAAVWELTQYAQPFVADTARAMVSRVAGSSGELRPVASGCMSVLSVVHTTSNCTGFVASTLGISNQDFLAGRKLFATAPYHWSGEFPLIKDFMNHTIRERMGGSGISEAASLQLTAFINAMPAAKNPNFNGTLTQAQARGKEAFAKAQCGTCHAGQDLYTNNQMADVGSLAALDNGIVTTKGINVAALDNGIVTTKGINVPSLLGVARTAPYLHDGSVATLADRVNAPGDRHGVTSQLSTQEKADLVEYLKTL